MTKGAIRLEVAGRAYQAQGDFALAPPSADRGRHFVRLEMTPQDADQIPPSADTLELTLRDGRRGTIYRVTKRGQTVTGWMTTADVEALRGSQAGDER